jgi:hypothetical protein
LHADRRVFVVETLPTDRHQLPKELRLIRPYRFWESDDSGTVFRLGFDRKHHHEYVKRLDDLATSLKELMIALAEPEPPTTHLPPESNDAGVLDLPPGEAAWLQNKRELGEYDVFLCHNTEDKLAVKDIGASLIKNQIVPWLDEWDLRPGFSWQQALEAQIERIKSAAVFVGESGFGPWQNMELDAFLREFVRRRSPVIPTILSTCENLPKLPIFLRGLTWVDFRKPVPEPMGQLIWGITGKRPGAR